MSATGGFPTRESSGNVVIFFSYDVPPDILAIHVEHCLKTAGMRIPLGEIFSMKGKCLTTSGKRDRHHGIHSKLSPALSFGIRFVSS